MQYRFAVNFGTLSSRHGGRQKQRVWANSTPPPPIRIKLKSQKNANIFKTTTVIITVHNLISFSIVFTNKNRGGVKNITSEVRLNPANVPTWEYVL